MKRHLFWMVMFLLIGAMNAYNLNKMGIFDVLPGTITASLICVGLCLGCAWDCMWTAIRGGYKDE